MADVRVVVVDDQLDAADMLAAALELDGYHARVTQTFDSVDHYFRKPVDLAALRRLLSL